ncbi:threonylcarbamoyl-AMP synthase, partial [Salinimicrobium sp. MT39]|nr:threonylcarbamoyl-AMP synthase [Salinimicrobium profundisediminis]
PGGITAQQIEEVIGKITVDPALLDSGQKPKSPGMKYRHYAPDAALVLVKGEREDIQRLILEKQQEGLKVGVLTTEENENFYQADKVIACGSRKNLDSVAGSLYDTLRNFNSADLDLILSEMFPDEGVGQAIMNRLVKAAGYRIISI